MKQFIIKHKLSILIAGILVSASLILAPLIYNPLHQMGNTVPNKTQLSFEDYTNNLFIEQLSGDTLSLHFYLLNPHNHGFSNLEPSLGDYSYDSMVASQEYYINEINKLKSINYQELSTCQKITCDTLLNYFTNQLDYADLCLCSQVLSPTTGLQAQLPILFSEYQFTCEKDIQDYIALLNQVKDYFSSICEFQKLKAKNNSFISAQSCDNIISQCQSFIADEPTDNLLSTSFSSRIDALDFLTDNQKKDYYIQNTTAIKNSILPAYNQIITTLSQLKQQGYCKNSKGLCYLKDGKDYYEFLVKNYTGSSKSILELKASIQQNLANDMKTLYSLLNVSPEIKDDFYSDTSTNDSPSQILEQLNQNAKKDFPIPANLNYEVKYVDKSLEKHLSPAFFLAASIDAPDKNTIYINNGTSSNQNLFTTLAHEGIPGHMLQSVYFSQTNPLPIRYLTGCGGYTEGWATYVEFMSYHYLHKQKQLADALACSASYSLALYSICDIGINYEGWSLEDTISFLSNYSIDDKKICQNIYQAVVEEPANYLQYYVGYLEIISLKDQMQKSLGENFNLKTFHQAFLTIGPTDFSVVEKWLNYVYTSHTSS